MGFWSRFSDRWLGPRIQPPVQGAARATAPAVTVPAQLAGDGSFSLPIVGESKYQDALERICGRRTRAGHDIVTVASLLLEDDNPYDPMAVRVAIQGQTVGYLTRDKARTYRERLAARGCLQPETTCHARIRGGWYRGANDVGSFGVQLDVNLSGAPRRKP